MDPLNPGHFLAPPTEQSAEDFDRLHSFNWQLNVILPEDFGVGTWRTFLRDASMYLVYSAQSGEPFTRISTVDGRALEDYNRSRLPWFHSGDMRITKGFTIGGALHLDLFMLVKNFFDVRNIVHVNPTTGAPDLTGIEERESRSPVIRPQFKLAGAPEGFPLPLDQILPEFRERFRRQDLDGDGVIMFGEAQEVLRRAMIASGASPYNYGEPRQVRFGAELSF